MAEYTPRLMTKSVWDPASQTHVLATTTAYSKAEEVELVFAGWSLGNEAPVAPALTPRQLDAVRGEVGDVVVEDGATDGYVATWDAALGKFVPKVSASGGLTLAQVQAEIASVITEQGATGGDVPTYDMAQGRYIPGPAPQGTTLTQVRSEIAAVITEEGAADGEVAIWDAALGKYAPGPATQGTTLTQVRTEIADVITEEGAVEGEAAIWDAALGKYTPRPRPELSNYVRDPDMQNRGTWTAFQGSITFPAVTVGPDGGSDQVLRFATTNGTAQDAREARFPVSAGQTLYMRAWLRRQATAPTAGSAYLTIYCYDSTGTVMTATPAGNVATIPAANVLTAGSYHEGSMTIPAGAVEAQVSIRLSSTITSGALFDADRVEVRHMVQERHVGDAAIKERHLDPILLDDLARVSFRPVNVREAYGTDDASVRAAAADAQAGGRALYFPAGNYYATGDLSFDMDGLHLWGDGGKTQINLTDGAVLLDGFSSAHLMRPSLRDITIVRTGTGGAALYAKGAGTGTGVARLTASNLDLRSANGAAMQYEGSYIAAFHGCYFRSSLTGIRMKLEATTNTVGSNLVSFFGGEAQGNSGSGVHLSDCRGVSFYGFGIEGNGGNLSSAGALVDGDSHSVNFKDCYLELNKGAVDIDIAPNNINAGPFIVEGCTFYDYAAEKNQIVYFRNGHCFANYNRFNDLSDNAASRAIRVDAPVIGEARHNWVVTPQGGQLYGISSTNTTFTTA